MNAAIKTALEAFRRHEPINQGDASRVTETAYRGRGGLIQESELKPQSKVPRRSNLNNIAAFFGKSADVLAFDQPEFVRSYH